MKAILNTTPRVMALLGLTLACRSVAAVDTTTAPAWAVGPPLVPSGFANPQGHLTLTDALGTVLLSGDVLLLNPDQLLMTSATDSVSTTTFVPQLVITKLTP